MCFIKRSLLFQMNEMIGFFIFLKMRSNVYFSYKNAFHIKGVIILGEGGLLCVIIESAKNLEWHCLFHL